MEGHPPNELGVRLPFFRRPAHLTKFADQFCLFWFLSWIRPDMVPANIPSRYLWNQRCWQIFSFHLLTSHSLQNSAVGLLFFSFLCVACRINCANIAHTHTFAFQLLTKSSDTQTQWRRRRRHGYTCTRRAVPQQGGNRLIDRSWATSI